MILSDAALYGTPYCLAGLALFSVCLRLNRRAGGRVGLAEVALFACVFALLWPILLIVTAVDHLQLGGGR